MIRLAARAAITLLANAVALLVADLVLDQMELDLLGLVTASVIFTVVAVLIEPLIRQIALKSAPAILGSSALVATIVSLFLTTLMSDHLEVHGVTTWVVAAVLIWAVALAANLLLPLVVFKKVLSEAREG